MPISVKLIAALVFLLCALGAGWVVQSTRAENKRLQEAVAQAEVAAAASKRDLTVRSEVAVRHNQRVQSARQNERKAHEEIMAQEPDWASQRVPDNVLDTLGL